MTRKAHQEPVELQATDEYLPLGDTAPAPPAPEPVPLTKPEQPAAPKKSTPQKTSVLGDFRLVAILGQGAMGTVYRARQISCPRDAAVKVLAKELAQRSDFVQRFLREAR